MSEQKRTSTQQESEDNLDAMRDAQDTRESNAPVRPGSGAPHATELPRGGQR